MDKSLVIDLGGTHQPLCQGAVLRGNYTQLGVYQECMTCMFDAVLVMFRCKVCGEIGRRMGGG